MNIFKITNEAIAELNPIGNYSSIDIFSDDFKTTVDSIDFDVYNTEKNNIKLAFDSRENSQVIIDYPFFNELVDNIYMEFLLNYLNITSSDDYYLHFTIARLNEVDAPLLKTGVRNKKDNKVLAYHLVPLSQHVNPALYEKDATNYNKPAIYSYVNRVDLDYSNEILFKGAANRYLGYENNIEQDEIKCLIIGLNTK